MRMMVIISTPDIITSQKGDMGEVWLGGEGCACNHLSNCGKWVAQVKPNQTGNFNPYLIIPPFKNIVSFVMYQTFFLAMILFIPILICFPTFALEILSLFAQQAFAPFPWKAKMRGPIYNFHPSQNIYVWILLSHQPHFAHIFYHIIIFCESYICVQMADLGPR